MATHSYEDSLQPQFFCQTSSLSTAKEPRRRARRCATVTQLLRNRLTEQIGAAKRGNDGFTKDSRI
ncbi:hypothetical protein SBV1_3200002 [Verrucomicrobia bacterium]|nr:hypothetical protein SBV1_3200002 [Verrucomicrobiota bacterium]